MRAFVFICFAALLFISARADGGVQLNSKNFDKEVVQSGKSALIKFYAPWCGHCKKLAPIWMKLGAEYEKSGSVVIGSVDCTVETALCTAHGIRGYPTIKFFTPGSSDGVQYEGAREDQAFRDYIKANSGPQCAPSSPELCTAEQVAVFTKHAAVSVADLEKMVTEKQAELKQAEEVHNTFVEGLQKQYEESNSKFEELKKSQGEEVKLLKALLKEKKDATKESKEEL